MLKKGTQIRSLLFESLNEREEPFFYLAPDMINSVTDANMDMNKGVFIIKFSTVDGRDMGLTVKNDSVHNWLDGEIGENDGMLEFLKHFIGNSKSQDDEGQENLDEIVDEYGDLMSDDDMPNNSNNSMIGKSKFDSGKAIQQTIPKSRRYYGDMGLGVITW
jgi:hypothetical protein